MTELPARLDPKTAVICLDACALNASEAHPASATRQLRRLADAGELTTGLTPSVVAEVAHPATPATVAAFAASLPVYRLRASREDDARHQRAIERRLTGRRKRGSARADARHLFEAHLAGADFFVTADRRILRCGRSIARRLRLHPVCAVALLDLVTRCSDSTAAP